MVISLRWILVVVILVIVIVVLLTTLVIHGWRKNFCPELTQHCGLMALRSFLLALCHHMRVSCLLVFARWLPHVCSFCSFHVYVMLFGMLGSTIR